MTTVTTTTINIRAAWRDLSCKGTGPEAHRRVWENGQWQWVSDEYLPRIEGQRAHGRRATIRGDVLDGALVATMSREVVCYQRRGRATVEFGIAGTKENGAPVVRAVESKRDRATGHYTVTLPDGSTVTVPDPRERD